MQSNEHTFEFLEIRMLDTNKEAGKSDKHIKKSLNHITRCVTH